ncbi:hypothetical protein AvCA_22580 [Azotobacter vinelandii CA]|uniref:Uncharacterized protein n=2 Tax=Azotobacter vinelandii TaxID=354 RepID=C1DGD8_AZOVD|nr:hypothetical protein [Azotobacter vinelandii]ACO78449.1 hypothetical protein Avin_22580 [Azotobacter vinelandii DJ]AGK15007.1 hypothetical protein AvCA_22580 [Azotobacter vinelandii CA]AGK20515.1 hypothetical protein AvCA6_22580 [Azotobacter vinelandii CA6]WKN24146.1 hypothetical protein AVAEIV_002288 [Azotobacter vinelandii]SFY18366.1 hypothetical protein SAMN04244547_04350 [Azotobacter vinelandii]
MNIWALQDKHQDIRHVLLLLSEQLGPDAFVIDATTSLDPRAIYLQHREEPGVRAWLYTLGQSPGRYGVHLEYPNSTDTHENVPLAELVAMLAVHFDVPTIQPLP